MWGWGQVRAERVLEAAEGLLLEDVAGEEEDCCEEDDWRDVSGCEEYRIWRA